jgi:hypothetical protein
MPCKRCEICKKGMSRHEKNWVRKGRGKLICYICDNCIYKIFKINTNIWDNLK